MFTDPAASMRVWAVELNLAGRVFEIPALPAADWLPLLMEGDVTSVLDLIEDPALDQMILSGEVTPTELAASVNMAVEQMAGRSVHQVTVLTKVARLQWTVVGGDLARRGMRWDDVPLAAALDAIHVTILAHLRTTPNEEETRAGLPSPAQRFQTLMEDPAQHSGEPTPGRARTRRPDRTAAVKAFEEMAGPKPAPAPVPATATAAPSGGGRPRTRQQPRQRPRAGR